MPRLLFWSLLGAIVLAGLVRSWIATSLDSLQIDEAWHAVAGVSYVQRGDYRLNPEHPPLVKLWVGAGLVGSGFKLPPFVSMSDKDGEREYAETAFHLDNDSKRAQRRVRVSMLAWHGLVLLALGWIFRRAFGGAVALVAIGVLVVDPTVAAHLPVMLTDLPLSLLATGTLLLAHFAFQTFRVRDLALASVALGLTLATKHTAVVVGLAVFLLGTVRAFRRGPPPRAALAPRLGGVAALLVGSYVVLWGCYGFRFEERGESPSSTAAVNAPTFNRSIEDKLSDLRAPVPRQLIEVALAAHLLPRAYLWGLADIVRAGLEARTDVFVLGQMVRGGAPWYFFPVAMIAKLPLGILLLALAGLVVFALRREPRSIEAPLRLVLGFAALYLAFIMRGNSAYAGVRHALPAYPAIALLAALPLVLAFSGAPTASKAAVGVAAMAAVLSALPQRRPWEYYNELVGGPEGAGQYFSDEGVDSGQRVHELADYYDRHLRGTGERVYDYYGLGEVDRKAHNLQFDELEALPVDSRILEGTVFIGTQALIPMPAYDHAVFREAAKKPIARLGNLVVLRGRFEIPWLPYERKTIQAYEALDATPPDRQRAEELLSEVVRAYPADHYASFELANLLLQRADERAALAAYELSRDHAPAGDQIIAVLTDQIGRIHRRQPVRPLRSPWLE